MPFLVIASQAMAYCAARIAMIVEYRYSLRFAEEEQWDS